MSREEEYWRKRAEKFEERLFEALEQVGFWKEAARLEKERADRAEAK